MIHFRGPAPKQLSLSNYMEIVNIQKRAGNCVGFFIRLGEEFFKSGVSEVDNDILPTSINKAGSNVNPRVIPSYAMLLWFTSKVRLCQQSFILTSNATRVMQK